MSNEDITEQQATEGFAHMRAILNRRGAGPAPTPPTWLADCMRKVEAEKAAEKAAPAPRQTQTVAEIFGKVKANGPYTAADARVDLDDRADDRDQGKPENETEDYGK